MEEEKLIRKKKKALNGSNKLVLAEACNSLASYYYKLHRHKDALDEYKTEATIYKELGLRLQWGTCSRMVGEMYTLMGEFTKALKYEKQHLAVAKELQDKVEEQRAMATLGRIYLLQGQSTNGDLSNGCLDAAEQAFIKGLELCESLKEKINKRELMDMRARLLLNLGVVQEYLGHLEKAKIYFEKAIAISTNHDLYEVLHLCYTSEASLLSTKKKDYAKALSCLNKALEVDGRLEDKVIKMCETLSSKAEILCKMSDYYSARQVLQKAWKLNTPDPEEKNQIETNLKVAVAMCNAEELLVITKPSDHGSLKNLYEKLGDGACHFRNYSAAIDYYLKMLDHAVLAGETGKALVPIYVSLYQTYKDLGLYNEAIDYYEKEYELIKDVPKEAYTTLINIAELLFLAGRPFDQVEKACLDARKAAQDWNKKKYEIRTLKNLMKYQEEYNETTKIEETKNELAALGYDGVDDSTSEDDESSTGTGDEDAAHIGDDVCLEDLTDFSDTNEEDVTEITRQTRKRVKGYPIKKNMKGETQLHVACISGNSLVVDRLLGKGHPVNVRDNAGWLPLHEACIHGHLAVVDVLLDHGAHVNDRGGANCDGITPLYDAACNGHLEIVQLLLQKGAIPTLKTDFDETPLNALQKWRAQNILSKEQESLYNSVCSRMSSCIDRTTTVDILNRSGSKTPVKSARDCTPSTSSKNSSRESSACKRRNIIDCDSDDEIYTSRNQTVYPSDDSSDDERPTDGNPSGVKEYRNAISALRNRGYDLPEVDVKKSKPRSALITDGDVVEDWLEDDLGRGNRNKKRKLSDPLDIVVTKRPSIETVKNTIENINKLTEPLMDSNRIGAGNQKSWVNIDISDNDSDSGHSRTSENLRPRGSEINQSRQRESLGRDSREKMKRRWKTQSSLLRAGFERRRESNSESESDNVPRRESNKRSPRKSLSRNSSGESFEIVQSLNSKIVQPLNVIQPINIVQSTKNGRPMQTHIAPPAAVKVHVEDKVFLISLKLNQINRMTISWLVEETKNRYYKLTGTRPEFNLLTSDGAILSEDDPLSLVLSSPELKTCIINWKASPAEERYLECCDALEISPSEEIQQTLARSHTTRRLALGSKTLASIQIRPLFRAITHQSHITSIIIPENNIGDDAVKYLCETIITMKNLTHLDLARNNITSVGAKSLLNVFEKSQRPVCQGLNYLDLSSNPISDEGFKCVSKLGQYVKLKVLKLNNCNLTEQCCDTRMNFDTLECIDMSNNYIKQGALGMLVSSLNPNSLTELHLDRIGVDGKALGCIVSALDKANDLNIRRLSLSNCELTDGQFIRILRCLGRAKNLQSLTLRGNLITFITLKKLLQRQPPVPQIYVEGCQSIFKFALDTDFSVWLPAIDFGRCIPEINVTKVFNTDEERESFHLFTKTWLDCFKGRGCVEHCEENVTKFTAR